MSRAYHRDSVPVQSVYIAANVQHQRRVVNLPQPRWIAGVVERYELHARGICLGDFVLRQFERFASAERLRGSDGQSRRLECGERSIEHGLNPAEELDQFP